MESVGAQWGSARLSESPPCEHGWTQGDQPLNNRCHFDNKGIKYRGDLQFGSDQDKTGVLQRRSERGGHQQQGKKTCVELKMFCISVI